ncbi:nucleotidyl transferase AbiEii/AbiGii toxin family protein [Candidatus Roizmanbacteria bacterium]|nr:nucleotidyl transferase AbiEii/AbiGii toxin family protein [Candidatus Roizmanbacteria bacterium]
MGEMLLFSQEQKHIFDKISNNTFLQRRFYFTGGTALSYFYLQHRYSEDLDFFSEVEFDHKEILAIMKQFAKEGDFNLKADLKEVVYIFNLRFKNGKQVKVDFGRYPYRRVEKGQIFQKITVDSLIDIAINKLSAINQRSQVRDYVDLYFLLEKFTIWDLIEGVRVKFHMEIEPWILSSDLAYTIEKFDLMPRMIKPVTLDELKKFFREKAKELAKKAVTP